MTEKQNYTDRIAVDTKVHFGKPCVARTRIPVENVLELVQENMPFQEIIDKYYQDLEIEDIKACVLYANTLVRSEEIHAETSWVQFLADQDVYRMTIDHLRQIKHGEMGKQKQHPDSSGWKKQGKSKQHPDSSGWKKQGKSKQHPDSSGCEENPKDHIDCQK